MSTENSLKFANFGTYSFNLHTRELKNCDEVVPLRPKASLFLKLLINANKEIVSHKELYKEIWGNTVVQQSDGLHQLAREVRQSIADENCNILINVPGIGYKFEASFSTAPHVTNVLRLSPKAAYLGGFFTLPAAFLVYCLIIAAGLGS